jgi:hypothetical protein
MMRHIIRVVVFVLLALVVLYFTRNIENFIIQTFVTGLAILIIFIVVLDRTLARKGFIITATIFVLLSLAYMLGVIHP